MQPSQVHAAAKPGQRMHAVSDAEAMKLIHRGLDMMAGGGVFGTLSSMPSNRQNCHVPCVGLTETPTAMGDIPLRTARCERVSRLSSSAAMLVRRAHRRWPPASPVPHADLAQQGQAPAPTAHCSSHASAPAGRTPSACAHLDAEVAAANLQQQQHAGPPRVAHIHHPIQVAIPAAGAPAHVAKVGRLVVQRELQDAQALEQPRHLQRQAQCGTGLRRKKVHRAPWTLRLKGSALCSSGSLRVQPQSHTVPPNGSGRASSKGGRRLSYSYLT